AEVERAFRRRGRGRAGARRRPAGARPAGKRDQCDLAFPGRDRGRRVPDMGDVGGAAHLRRVQVAAAEPQVLRHRERPEAGGVTGAEVGVDVAALETGVAQSAEGDLSVDLGHRKVGDLPSRVLVSPSNERGSTQAQRFSSKREPGSSSCRRSERPASVKAAFTESGPWVKWAQPSRWIGTTWGAPMMRAASAAPALGKVRKASPNKAVWAPPAKITATSTGPQRAAISRTTSSETLSPLTYTIG